MILASARMHMIMELGTLATAAHGMHSARLASVHSADNHDAAFWMNLQWHCVHSAELKAQEGYNARERRALGVRGGTDTVPLPSWLAGSQAAGRASGTGSE